MAVEEWIAWYQVDNIYRINIYKIIKEKGLPLEYRDDLARFLPKV